MFVHNTSKQLDLDQIRTGWNNNKRRGGVSKVR